LSEVIVMYTGKRTAGHCRQKLTAANIRKFREVSGENRISGLFRQIGAKNPAGFLPAGFLKRFTVGRKSVNY